MYKSSLEIMYDMPSPFFSIIQFPFHTYKTPYFIEYQAH